MNKDYTNALFTVYSEKHDDLGYFVKIGKGDDEIVVETGGKEYTYDGFDSYVNDDWEFIGLL